MRELYLSLSLCFAGGLTNDERTIIIVAVFCLVGIIFIGIVVVTAICLNQKKGISYYEQMHACIYCRLENK